MSLASTSTLKSQIKSALGANSNHYFEALNQFVSARISRVEFEETLRRYLTSPVLVQLHNALVISLFDASSHQRPPTPPPDLPSRPPRKRRRIWPYQGPGPEDAQLHASRLKRWSVGLGRRERERLKTLTNASPLAMVKLDRGEIGAERGVTLLSERGDPPGSRLPIQLASSTRALAIQYISERINLVLAQHNLGAPSKLVAPLIMLAVEAKLKQLITHALTLTSSSPAISSINTSQPHTASTLSATSFDTLFTLSPAALPNKSAAAMHLMSERPHGKEVDEEEVKLLRDKETRDYRWQLLALLGERSTMKYALSGMAP